MVVLVRHDGIVGQHFRVLHPSNEDGVGADIDAVDDVGLKIREGVVEDDWCLGGPKFGGDVLEFIDGPSGFEAKRADEGHRGVLGEDGYRKDLAVLDVLVGEVLLVDADGNGAWLGSDLEDGVGDLPVSFLPVS